MPSRPISDDTALTTVPENAYFPVVDPNESENADKNKRATLPTLRKDLINRVAAIVGTAVVDNVIDVTKPLNTLSISAPVTLSFSATPDTGSRLLLRVSNSDSSAQVVTIPSVWSEALGANRTTLTVPASGSLTVALEREAGGWAIFGDPVSMADLTSTSEIDPDVDQVEVLTAAGSRRVLIATILALVAAGGGAGLHIGDSPPTDPADVLWFNVDDAAPDAGTLYVMIGDVPVAVAGPPGGPGSNGTNGNTILSGTAEPTTEGEDGDFYIRTTTSFFYGPKAGGVWPAGVSLVGAPGAPGPMGPKAIAIANPTNSENITMFFTAAALTLSQVRAVVGGSSPSVTYSIRSGTDRSASGTLNVDGATVTNTTAGADATIANAAIAANSWVWITTSAISGTVSRMAVSLNFS